MTKPVYTFLLMLALAAVFLGCTPAAPGTTASSSKDPFVDVTPLRPVTSAPTTAPSVPPATEPPVIPTTEPTVPPTTKPPVIPTTEPTVPPTTEPPVIPTTEPTVPPTTEPPVIPTTEPTVPPTTEPPVIPTTEPTVPPTTKPPVIPTTEPSVPPTTEPPVIPTTEPTVPPTTKPPVIPTTEPTVPPTTKPPVIPTTEPTVPPTTKPPVIPTTEPTVPPTTKPPVIPTTKPTVPPTTKPPATTEPTKDPIQGGLENEADKLPDSGIAIPDSIIPKPSGTLVKSNGEAIIDYSNTTDGYVMVKYTAATDKRLKAQVKGPSGTTYTYNLTVGEWAAFPLSDENGSYKITIYKNVSGTKYATVLSLTTQVKMTDAFAPFLRSNQFVDIANAPKTAAKAAQLCKGLDTLDKVTAVYNFVVKGMSYDTQLAATVQSGYTPDLDAVLGKMTGICFDYAALMTGMLRSQGVPCKLVVGYAGSSYHAWISVWSEGTGWIEGLVFFDGTSWKRMDPTYASSGTGQDYIGNDKNYTVKYVY